MSVIHGSLTQGQIHLPYRWTYASAAARTAATGFTSSDLYGIALQTDTFATYVLTAISPVAWTQFGSTASQPALTDQLVAYWHLNDVSSGSGHGLYDATGHGYNLSVVTNTGTGPVTSSSGQGIIDSTCVSFGGNSNGGWVGINTPNDWHMAFPPIGYWDWTIAGWIYINSAQTGTACNFCSINHNAASSPGTNYGGSVMQFRYDAGTTWNFVVNDATSTNTSVNNATTLPTVNVWHWVLMQFDATNKQIGFCLDNGTMNYVSYTNSTVMRNQLAAFQLGWNSDASSGTWNFNGRMNGWGFWLRLLTPGNRNALYNAGAGIHPI